MKPSIKLREERRQILLDARKLLDKAESENRSLNQEESTNYDKAFKDAEDLLTRAERLEKQDEIESTLQEIRSKDSESAIRHLNKEGKESKKDESAEIRAFRTFLTDGIASLSIEQRNTLQMDSQTKSGFLVAPQQFVNTLIKKIDDLLFIRNLATVHPLIGAHSLGMPSLETDVADADWTGEITPVSTGSMDFGKRELSPKALTKLIKVSRKLIRHSSQSIESLVSDRMAYKLAVPQERSFLVGNGVNQALGVFFASNDGIPTSRDVSTDNTSTAVTFDGLKNAKGALKAGYRAKAQWVMHRDLETQVSKIKDLEGRYVWQDSIIANEPDVLLGFPVNKSEYAPNTFTTGLYVAVLGDFSFYHIAESLSLEMQRLDELYAATNEVGFIGRAEVDGMPVLPEAFVRVKLG